jgi:hypothetical protein
LALAVDLADLLIASVAPSILVYRPWASASRRNARLISRHGKKTVG